MKVYIGDLNEILSDSALPCAVQVPSVRKHGTRKLEGASFW